MPYIFNKSSSLSKSKLEKAIKLMRPSDKALARRIYWEYVPDDRDYSDDQAMEFIICAMPGPGNYTASGIALLMEEMIRQRKRHPVHEKGDPLSLPEMARRALSLDGRMCREAMECIRRHKHVPEHVKASDQWALAMAIATGIGHVVGNGGYATEASEILEPVLAGAGVMDALDAAIKAAAIMRIYS